MPAFVRRLEQAGARGVAVFNRFYQPDIDLETLDVDRHAAAVDLRGASAAPARAGAALADDQSSRSRAPAGVHSGLDAAKAMLCGAHVVQLASVLLRARPRSTSACCATSSRAGSTTKGYRSSAEARGVLDLRSAPDPHAWERLNYTRMLEGFRPGDSWRKTP